MALYSVLTNYKTTLAQGMTSSQSTMVVSSITLQGHDITSSDYGSYLYFTINPGASNMEVVRATSNASTTFTLDKRGLAWYGDNDTELSSYKFTHNAGEVVIVSNVKNIFDVLVDKVTDETIAGVKTFSSSPIVPTPTTATQAANKDYVDGVAIAGGADSSTTVKGITKMSVAPASATSPIAVGDNDGRVPTQAENDALVGNNTGIPVGTGNKFVTQTGLQAAAETYAVDSVGTDAYSITLSPVPAAIDAGFTCRAKFGTANTGAATITINGLGPYNLTKNGAVALETGDILANQVSDLFYDGTQVQVGAVADKISAANVTTLTGGATSNADTKHTHANMFGRFDSFLLDMSTQTLSYGLVGFSDATAKLITYGFSTTTPTIYYTTLGIATDYGNSLYTKIAPTTVGTSQNGVIAIGSSIWSTNNNSAAGNRILKAGTPVTISGTTPSGSVSQLGHDSTNSYLLALDSTTTILRYSGIAGTTITHVSTITLDTAITNFVGFIYDNTNAQYICLDITGNLIRRFNSSGVTVDTVPYTIDDGVTSGLTNNNVVGLVFISDRVHIVTMTVTDTGTPGFARVNFIPTSMTR